jgi:two-component system, OmpR family, sensor histidine kinase SenX3
MAVLLSIVGAALLFGLGFWAGRRAHRSADVEPQPPRVEDVPTDRALVEHHRDGVVVADGRGRIVYRNAAARALQGTHVGVLIDEAVGRHVAAASRQGRSDEVLEMYGPPKVVLVVHALALEHQTGVVVYIEDVSERRRIDQVRTDFVANISHELKTPVGAMSVLAETLQDEDDPDIVRRVVARMMGEAQRAARTIDDLIELSRIELGGEREIEPVRVDRVISEALERVQELAAHSDIGIANLAGADHVDGVVVHGDRRQLVSAVGNLVENAVKYSEAGGQVQVRTRLVDGCVEVAVIDQGVGIPQRDLDRIFERFYRVDRARSRATGGTGLGLSIVRHIAQNHGGDVEVDSSEGEGSTFTLRLPARRVGATPEPDAPLVDTPSAESSGDAGSGRPDRSFAEDRPTDRGIA